MSVVIACPHCGARNNRHTNLTSDGNPKDGDLTVCLYCRRAGVYVTGSLGLGIRALNAEEKVRWDRALVKIRAVMGESTTMADLVARWREREKEEGNDHDRI
jgi:hypothetical protein